MKLKLDENGAVVVKDGLPVWEMPDGAELAYDVPAAHKKIGELTTEARDHRKAKEAAEQKLAAFADLDPEKAKQALAFAQSMEGKKAMDDESIKAVVANAIKPFQDQLNAKEEALKEKEGHIYKLEVGNRFATSEYLREKTILGETPDIAEAFFSKNFKVENGKVIALDPAGNQIYSRVKPGEPADFDEAISILVESHPRRDHILKGTGQSGSGTTTSGKSTTQGAKTITRAQFDALDPSARSAHVSGGGTVTD